MSTNHTAPTPNTAAELAAAPPAETTPPGDVEKLRSEAATRRRQLRETEATRDALAADLDAARGQLTEWKARQVCDALAGTVANIDTLTALGFNPAEYVRDDYSLDLDAARARAAELRDAHGLAAAPAVSSVAEDVAAELDGRVYAPPAELLRGDTADELRAHRDALAEWASQLQPVGPVVPGENAGSGPLPESDWLKQMFEQRR